MTQTGAELGIVSPEGDFSLDGYDTVVCEYLHELLAADKRELEPFRAVAENNLCLDGADEGDLSDATRMSGPFAFK